MAGVAGVASLSFPPRRSYFFHVTDSSPVFTLTQPRKGEGYRQQPCRRLACNKAPYQLSAAKGGVPPILLRSRYGFRGGPNVNTTLLRASLWPRPAALPISKRRQSACLASPRLAATRLIIFRVSGVGVVWRGSGPALGPARSLRMRAPWRARRRPDFAESNKNAPAVEERGLELRGARAPGTGMAPGCGAVAA